MVSRAVFARSSCALLFLVSGRAPGLLAERGGVKDGQPQRLDRRLFMQFLAFHATGASPVWRVHVQARTPDGVTFARDAVLRPLVDPRRPLITLLWQEGAQDPVSAPAPTGNSAQENGTGKP